MMELQEGVSHQGGIRLGNRKTWNHAGVRGGVGWDGVCTKPWTRESDGLRQRPVLPLRFVTLGQCPGRETCS